MSETNQNEGQLTSEVIARLREEGVQFFLNSENVPSLFIAEDHFQNDWPVASQRCQDYVETVWYEVGNKALPDAKAKRFLYMQIREECRTGGRRLSQAEVPAAEKDPIVQALMALMNKMNSYSDRTSKLKTELGKHDVDARKDGIPVFTNIFSRRLKRLIPALKGMGISVRIEHREDGSFCDVERMPTFDVEYDGFPGNMRNDCHPEPEIARCTIFGG